MINGVSVVVDLVYVAVMICTLFTVGFKVVLVVNLNLIGDAVVVVAVVGIVVVAVVVKMNLIGTASVDVFIFEFSVVEVDVVVDVVVVVCNNVVGSGWVVVVSSSVSDLRWPVV